MLLRSGQIINPVLSNLLILLYPSHPQMDLQLWQHIT
jgi:hypothetical protein